MTTKTIMDNEPRNGDGLTPLEQEKAALVQQVKRLVRAESRLYEYQEELDAQLREYKALHELNRKINGTFDIRKIFEYSTEYIIHNLEYERVIFFEQFDNKGNYTVCTIDGYYNQQERDRATQVVIGLDDPFLAPLHGGAEFIICEADSGQKEPAAYRNRLLMNEYMIFPLCPHKRPHAILAVGNSAENAEFYRRVRDSEEALFGIGNLVGLLISAVENHIFYTNMENALEQEKLVEAKYRSIFENAIEGILQTTPDGRFLSCNPATAAILGFDSPKELIASVPAIEQLYVSPQRRTELYQLMRQHGDVKNFEAEMFRKDGSRQWVLVSARPVFNENGEMLYVDGMLQDISERKQAELALHELNEELEQRVVERTKELETANLGLRQISRQLEGAYDELKSAQSRILQQEKMASIGQLAAGVAHEINNPMGFIISNLTSFGRYTGKIRNFMTYEAEAVEKLSIFAKDEAIVEDLRQQRKSQKIDFILQDLEHLLSESLDGAERIKKIVQDLKSFSHIDEAEMKMANINQGLESTINIVWNDLKYKADLIREFGSIPETKCNPGQLNQVFMNILLNAVQAIENHGEITIRTVDDRGNIRVMISDTGKGIPPDKQARIFEPFYTTKEVGKGTGLGLSIAYDIIKKHSGDIRVESEVGKGTTFTIVIPVVE